ncbi:MAG: TetR/AcrR family transcriptional regulator [Anaerolineae bacterium]|nr:TetR/AcrR family transcriptional regulator [Anaerolineae bacterium]
MTYVQDKRTAILEATLKLISQNGFHGTAMSKVASEAGVSAGIIYHYFDSKDDLIDELYRHIKVNFGQMINDSFDQTQPLKVQIRQMLGLMMHYYIRRPLESAFIEQYTRSPYFNPEIEQEVEQYYRPVLDCFYRGQQEVIIKDLPAPVMHTLTIDVATALAQKHAAGIINLTDELIEKIIDACWEAIRQ